MTRLNVLVIAPQHPDLAHVAAEVAAYKRHHYVVALTGIVRDLDIANAVENGPFDVIVFASHGQNQGVLLSESMLTIEAAQQYVRRSGATLAVLNTCDSEEIGYRLLGEGCDVISTISPVADVDAVRFGMLLASALLASNDYKTAFEMSIGEGTKYRYLTATVPTLRSSGRREDSVDVWTMVYHLQTEVAVQRTLMIMALLVLVVIAAFEVALWFRTDSLLQQIGALSVRVTR